MKALITFAALFVSANASADILKTPCDLESYQKLQSAFNSAQVEVGEELKAELEGILTQEMGPKCETVMDTELNVGIPGQENTDYEISTAENFFEVTVSERQEERRTVLLIYKK